MKSLSADCSFAVNCASRNILLRWITIGNIKKKIDGAVLGFI